MRENNKNKHCTHKDKERKYIRVMTKHEVGVMTNLFNNYRLVMCTFLLAQRTYIMQHYYICRK